MISTGLGALLIEEKVNKANLFAFEAIVQLGTRTDNFTCTNLNFLEHYVHKIVPSKKYNKFIKCIGRFRKKSIIS